MFSFSCVHHGEWLMPLGLQLKMSPTAARNRTWVLCKYKFS